LEPITVVKAIIAALDEQHSRTVYLPFYANFVPLLRLLPSFLRDFAQWVGFILLRFLSIADNFLQFTNADHSMENFTKITGRREDEGPVPDLSRRSKND